jgi:carboxymethylenebutenolidase
MITEEGTIPVGSGQMPYYLSRPQGTAKAAIIMLEGFAGFDAEIRRVTDLVAGAGFVGCAIDYYYRQNLPAGERGDDAAKALGKADLCEDVAAARDWLNTQDYVPFGKIATWGFGFGGTVGFVTATLPGLSAAVVFYGQSIARTMPNGDPSPLADAANLRTPLLLVFGGQDRQISGDDASLIETTLTAANKKFEMQLYPNVGHSFFRESSGTVASREIADAWDLVQAFLARRLGVSND